jgi:thioredoxin reductase (NADPH)
MYDAIVIGKGPAGVTAAIYAARGNLKILVIGGSSSLEKAKIIDNYYGFPNGISGQELLKKGEEQLKKLEIELVEDSIISIEYINEEFEVYTKESKYISKAVLLATGRNLSKVKIDNLEKFEGKGVHYCVTCDGFFYNDLKVGILGYNDYAAHELIELANYSKNLSL